MQMSILGTDKTKTARRTFERAAEIYWSRRPIVPRHGEGDHFSSTRERMRPEEGRYRQQKTQEPIWQAMDPRNPCAERVVAVQAHFVMTRQRRTNAPPDCRYSRPLVTRILICPLMVMVVPASSSGNRVVQTPFMGLKKIREMLNSLAL